MAYNHFSVSKALTDLNLTVEDGRLFDDVAPHPLPASVLEALATGKLLALPINTEKAKSEFLVAPLLIYLKSILLDKVSLFSGVEFNVDTTRGLNGVCDFIISRARSQHVLQAPLIAIVEAKKDNIGDGLGQCIAEMYAAQVFNRQHSPEIERVYGIVTTGSAWKFLQLDGNRVLFDLSEYSIAQPELIVGIILHIIQHG